jgi:deoxyribose-phosphate aldolase
MFSILTMNLSDIEQWVSDQLVDNHDFTSDFGNEELKNIIQCIDLTTLNATDSPNSVLEFVKSGQSFLTERGLSPVAAFCVFSNFTHLVKEALVGSGISTACVATSFPHGQASLNVKLEEVLEANKQGADEIDVVINRGMVLDGDYDGVSKEIVAFKRVAGKAHVKVILEVCELTLQQVYITSQIAIEAGADFLKTSTGKGVSGANLEASLVMCLAIKEHYERTGKMIGFKAAGGISSSSEAIQYYNLVGLTLGRKWLTNEYFRIGTSSLLKNITNDLS